MVSTKSETPKIFKAAAWVAVVAGTLAIVAGIFFAGFGMAIYSEHASGSHHRQHGYPAMVMEIPNGGHGAPNHAQPSPAPAPTPGR
ncbi:hypothetical protein B1987_03325 [Mycobacterium kansasii]|uniref:Uncharacterized protein n=2 Tax=Mycobacterium attenuatum TaxID=2341086 RepID=A0A498Q4H2_9MYCO|nr:hypothetical protein B1987_03325 [Mycobacterium kansasii]VBA40247.1 hypothetical protein LAUMK136_03414 [Mycobacterium attenuatum]VBA59433.1 hypothetical protein LAUMK41_03484 [Mycobacterium attenuatum]